MSSTGPKTLAGVLERITFQNEDTGYTIARFLPDARSERSQDSQGDGLITLVGDMPGAAAGEALEVTGVWQHHSLHGWQFSVRSYKSVLPATAQGIRKYLGSGLIKGVGPKTADKIVDRFGVDTLTILETDPARLRDVRGIGARTVDRITVAWAEQRAIKDVMVFLQGQGVSASLAIRLYKQYGDAAITVAKNQPYRLAREVTGIGFKTADKIAQAMGVALDDPERLKAGALYALSEASDEGHTYLPETDLGDRATELLAAPREKIDAAIRDLYVERGAVAERVIRDGGEARFAPYVAALAEPRAAYGPAAPKSSDELAVYLPPFYHAESNVAKQAQRIAACPPERSRLAEFQQVDFAAMFDYLARTSSLQLSEKQQAGVRAALTRPLAALTGGPGTGKTTSLKALIQALQAKRKTALLAAPTGRAAKRLSEATGLEAKTLHRLLQLKPGGGAGFDAEHPLPADIVIVDESSMLDTLLANTLLKAIGTGTHLLLVGDADQLPSVGAGNVLGDILASGAVPVTRLDQIFRQAAESAIITNAHRINQGEMPLTGEPINDFFMFTSDDAEAVAALIVDLVTQRIPKRFGFAPADIQVLAPMRAGPAGVEALNTGLQAALNPAREGSPQRAFGNRVYRIGDKVMQTRNNYDSDVYNGDSGLIDAIDAEEQTVRVRFDDARSVDYAFSDLDQLALAYAVSVHKSQGSEYPCVVVPLLMSHYMLLERRLIYTAVTRARKLVVLVGSRRALAIAVKNAATRERFTGLRARLRVGIHA